MPSLCHGLVNGDGTRGVSTEPPGMFAEKSKRLLLKKVPGTH